MRRLPALLLAALLGFGLAANAQQTRPDDPPPAPSAPADGIQGQNIFDVKPERGQVKPDASSEPGYMKQNNAERNRVQPGNNAPMWRGVAGGLEGSTSYPRDLYPEMGVLIQAPVQYPGTNFTTAGEAWRQVRNNWIIPYGGALLLIVLGALAIFYFTRGPIGTHVPDTNSRRRIERFTPFERATHWANAIAFSILAITGIVMAFGKFFLLPVMGLALYGPFTWILKTLHNFAGPVFAVSLVLIILTFIRDNLPGRGDLRWLLKGGGFFGRKHEEPPSGRFNAGEKVIFWIGMLLVGVVAVGSGLVMDRLIPNLTYDRQTMQIAQMVHAVATVLMMCFLFGHIYMGTVGVRGSYTAMRTGYVDETWAQEHHRYWYEDIAAGKIPAQRSQAAGREAEQVRHA